MSISPIKAIKMLFGAQLDFRVRLYNILAAAGTLISLITGVSGLFVGLGFFNFLFCMITMALSAALLWYSFTSGKYQLCYIISIICIFLILFPAIFFSSGGYNSGMPSFFIFAVLFTVFMLEGKKMIFITVFELVVYTSLCIFAYYNPGMIISFNTEADILIDKIISYIIVSAALGITMAFHLRLYKERQTELEAARKQVEEFAVMKNMLFAGMSHEMRTPLTVMSVYAQFAVEQIKESGANEQTLADLAAISDEARRLAELADGTLNVLMTASGSYETGRRENKLVDINEIVSRLVRLMEPVAKRSGKSILISKENVPIIPGDTDALTQLVWNLLQNAITHSQGKTIKLIIEKEGSGVKLTVNDDGAGIDPAVMRHIFEPGAGGKSGGSGLGLSICRYIAKRHGGDINIVSKPGEGVSVTVFLSGAEAQDKNDPPRRDNA
ncbi:MAG: HAMP domain-containing histidine kinase [Treponema sp.]|nr:HAMP domain-containing histidine kinase [Treponema sp.]MCL2267212.1 HAMP domain-containing histidine kinase [Treponema sp.]